MKQIIVVAACIVMFGTTYAQKKTHHTASNGSASAKAEGMKNGLWGTIRDLSGEPLADVETMLYKVDTIVSSGFTNDAGKYVTNSCAAGKYNLKLVYPNTNKYIMVNGVEIKKGRVTIDIKTNPPMADSSISFAETQPKPAKNKNQTGRR